MIHGGSWRAGTADGYFRWCRYLAEHGVTAFSVTYRLSNEKEGIGPDVCLEDSKSAVRWVRKNSKKFGIDPNMIAIVGNSAGGHLAAACATIDGFNDKNDDLKISCCPNLLLLASPVMDNGPAGYGYERVEKYWKSFSPVHNLNNHLPATCVLLGDSDPLISVKSVEKFGRAVEASGQDFELYVFKSKGHGLCNNSKSYLTPPLMYIYYQWHQFLAKEGYIEQPLPKMEEPGVEVSRYEISQ